MNIFSFEKDFYDFIEKYVKTKKGQQTFALYLKTCNVTPKNIYTETTDFYERYKAESLIIYGSVLYFLEKGFVIENIIQAIPSLEKYYSWIKFLPFLHNLETDTYFDELFKKWLKSFHNYINQREYGEYYTPENMILLAFDEIPIELSQTVIDPACGSGFFLASYIKVLRQNNQLENIHHLKTLKQNLYGYDIFPFAIVTSKLLLGYQLHLIFPKEKLPFQFEHIILQNTLDTLACKNDLFKNDAKSFDLIIGNPPYFRIDPKAKNDICSCVSYGHNYVHSLFLHWSIQKLKEGGYLSLILPQSILSGFYYQKLRKELLQYCTINQIITNKKHEESFAVQQDIMILQAKKNSNESTYFKVATSSNDFCSISEKFKIPTNLTQNKLFVIPSFRHEEAYNSLKELAIHPIIERLYLLNFATGNFVWNQNKPYCFKEYQDKSLPLITGPNVTSNGIILNTDRKNNYCYCIPTKSKYIKKDFALLFRRMSPIGNSQRMVAALISPKDFPEYVVENHVNVISYSNKKVLIQLLKFITSNKFNLLINAFCHTNQVSINDLRMIFFALQEMRKTKMKTSLTKQIALAQ